MVCAMIAVGWPLVAAASAKAAWSAGMLWPSRSMVCQLKDAPFFGKRIERHDVVDEAVELDVIVVDYRDQVVDLLVAPEHGGFPDLAFLNFAVAEHDVSTRRAIVELRRERHADAD